jgi:hypothetical protein
MNWIGSARHGSAWLGSGEHPRTASEPIGIKNQLLQNTHETLRLEAGTVLAFRTLQTFGTFCSVKYSGTVPIPAEGVCAEPMQCAAFHSFPLSFISADCSVPNRTDPIRSSARPGYYAMARSYFKNGENVLRVLFKKHRE